jgi:hypothetical protein
LSRAAKTQQCIQENPTALDMARCTPSETSKIKNPQGDYFIFIYYQRSKFMEKTSNKNISMWDFGIAM